MKTLILMCPALTTLLVAAHAQIGWTLKQCRERFGPEFQPASGNTHYFHVGPWGRGLGEHVYISFDPDDTVGAIQWLKLDGKAFSEDEIQRRLKEASRVSWERSPDHDPGALNWTGVQNGKFIFDANEADNGRGTYILSISTRRPDESNVKASVVRVPFVGCMSDGQVGPQPAPNGAERHRGKTIQAIQQGFRIAYQM